MNCAVIFLTLGFLIPARVYLLVCLFKGQTLFQQFIFLSLNSHLLRYLLLAIKKVHGFLFKCGAFGHRPSNAKSLPNSCCELLRGRLINSSLG